MPNLMDSARAATIVTQITRLYREIRSIGRSLGARNATLYMAHLVRHLPQVVLSRNLRSVDGAMADHNWSFNIGGTTIEVEGRDFSQAREMYGRRVYFCRPGFQIRGGETVVDLGANVGLFSVLAAKRGARVIAVEAQQGYGAHIKKNATLNNCSDNIELELVMIGAGGVLSDSVTLRHPSQAENQPLIRMTMENLLVTHNVAHVDFLKIDIEGSEFSIISKDSDWLKCVDKIAMEVHPRFGDPEELKQHLISHGFATEFVDNDQRVVDQISAGSGYLFAIRLR